jgi:hypothetical protein
MNVKQKSNLAIIAMVIFAVICYKLAIDQHQLYYENYSMDIAKTRSLILEYMSYLLFAIATIKLIINSNK